MTQPKARTIEPAHAERLIAKLTAPRLSFTETRTAALVLLAWGAALKLSEALALDLRQVLTDPTKGKLTPVRKTGYLQPEQGGAGPFVITPRAQAALQRYLRELDRCGWLDLPAAGPLFLTQKGGRVKGAPSRTRLGKRAAQLCFDQVLRSAGVPEPYRFQDLRHDTLTSIGANTRNVFTVAQFGRLKDMRTAGHYVPAQTASLAQLASYAGGKP